MAAQAAGAPAARARGGRVCGDDALGSMRPRRTRMSGPATGSGSRVVSFLFVTWTGEGRGEGGGFKFWGGWKG